MGIEKNNITSNEILGYVLLVLSITSLGFSYVISRYARLYSGIAPLTFLSLCLMVNFLLVVILQLVKFYLFPDNVNLENDIPKITWSKVLFWGSIVAVFMVGIIASVQYALVTETAGQVSFIVGMYIVLVPFVEIITSNFESFPPLRTWLAIAMALAGLFFLSDCAAINCFDNGVDAGVWWSLSGMISIACHIITSAMATEAIGSTLTVVSSFTIGLFLAVVLALTFETDFYTLTTEKVTSNIWLIIGEGSTDLLGVLFMTTALNYLSASRAAIISSMESLSGAILGYLILGESLTALELVGGGLMLSGIALEVFPAEYCCCGDKSVPDKDEMNDTSNEEMPLISSGFDTIRSRSASLETIESSASKVSKQSIMSAASLRGRSRAASLSYF